MKKWSIEKVKKAIENISEVDVAFGTTKYLPEHANAEVWAKENRKYERLSQGIFFGNPPNGTIGFRDGVEQSDAMRLITAHLKSFEPKHEHKIAGVAFLLWQVTDTMELENY